MNIKKIIKEEIMRVVRENNNPTIAPPKPKVNPTTKPVKPPKRRPLTPPKTAPQTAPKAKTNELFIGDDDDLNKSINPEDSSQYGFKKHGDENISNDPNYNLYHLLSVIEIAIRNGNNNKALSTIERIRKEYEQVPGGSQMNEDEKQIAQNIAKRFASKKK